jgi:transmembrane sensor
LGVFSHFSVLLFYFTNMDNDRIWNLIAKKLAGEASSGDLRELESALRINPELHYSLEAMNDMWKKQCFGESGQSDIAFQKHIERMHSLGVEMGNKENNSSIDGFPDSPSRSMKWKITGFIISGFSILILGFYFLNLKTSAPTAPKAVWEVVTRNGTKTNLLLPDGSSVWLNAGSRLTYDSLYGNVLREVTLSGEAYFDVVKNPKKPFIIHTGKINIRVLGTTFNVKSYPGDKTIETSLIRGSIEVTFPSLPSKKIILKPNQKLIVNNAQTADFSPSKSGIAQFPSTEIIDHLTRARNDTTVIETAWLKNKLVFIDEPFGELAVKMERLYGVNIHFDNSSIDTLHFTGSFDSENIQQALNALRLSAQFNYVINNNDIQITAIKN